jgi:hypothetical protein
LANSAVTVEQRPYQVGSLRPNGQLTSGEFRADYEAGAPRILQLGLKFNF